jgi:hypothetical protein
MAVALKKVFIFLIVTTTLVPPMLCGMENLELSQHMAQPVIEDQKKVSEPFQHDLTPSDCMICLETMFPVQTLSIFPCTHVFHRACINQWLAEHKTCPCCRAVLGSDTRSIDANTDGSLLRRLVRVVSVYLDAASVEVYRSFSNNGEFDWNGYAVQSEPYENFLTHENPYDLDVAPHHQTRRLLVYVVGGLRMRALGYGAIS